jgi:pyrroline-5-carboxylate reductase
MGRAVLTGWLAAKTFERIHVIEPNPSRIVSALARRKKIRLHSELAKDLQPVAVVIALKPQVIRGAPGLMRAIGTYGAPVVSIAAGITTGFLREAIARDLPIIRTVPNTPGAIGQGIAALFAPPGIAPARRRLAAALMAPLGSTFWLEDESLLDAVTALSGSGPAYVFLLVECLARAGQAQGLSSGIALRLARQTIIGAGALLAADRRAPEELRREVTSPGGTTEAALRILMAETGLQALMHEAVAAGTRRSRELGR